MKKSLTTLETASITYFLTRACFMGISLNLILNLSKQDSYFSIISGSLLGFIPLLLYLLILKQKKDKNLHEFITDTFGKIIGHFIELIFFIFTLFFLAYLYREFSRFIQIEYLSKTPRIVIFMSFLIPTFYLLRKGINILGRVSLVLFYFSIILILVTFSSLIFQINFVNLLPIFSHTDKIMHSSFIYIGLNILPLFFLTILPYSNDKKTPKYIFWTYVISSIILFITAFLTVAILGFDLASTYIYPEFHLLKQVDVIGVLGHIESILAFQGIFDFFMLLAIGFYFLTTFFSFKYTNSLIFIFFILIYLMFPTISTQNIIIGSFAIYFILPLFLYIGSKITNKKSR